MATAPTLALWGRLRHSYGFGNDECGGRDRDARCVRLEVARTDLTRSGASRAYVARLEAAERYLGARAPVAQAPAAADVG